MGGRLSKKPKDVTISGLRGAGKATILLGLLEETDASEQDHSKNQCALDSSEKARISRSLGVRFTIWNCSAPGMREDKSSLGEEKSSEEKSSEGKSLGARRTSPRGEGSLDGERTWSQLTYAAARDCYALVWLVDASDEAHVLDSMSELELALQQLSAHRLERLPPLMVLCNKQDSRTAITAFDIEQQYARRFEGYPDVVFRQCRASMDTPEQLRQHIDELLEIRRLRKESKEKGKRKNLSFGDRVPLKDTTNLM